MKYSKLEVFESKVHRGWYFLKYLCKKLRLKAVAVSISFVRLRKGQAVDLYR